MCVHVESSQRCVSGKPQEVRAERWKREIVASPDTHRNDVLPEQIRYRARNARMHLQHVSKQIGSSRWGDNIARIVDSKRSKRLVKQAVIVGAITGQCLSKGLRAKACAGPSVIEQDAGVIGKSE